MANCPNDLSEMLPSSTPMRSRICGECGHEE